ncbi:MAG: hypothetical protein PHU51_04670 [Candidatus Nanoarchaeia archaeon]|nr:hypothetical protein [Candidatus Nanoarchaeia archaeon]
MGALSKFLNTSLSERNHFEISDLEYYNHPLDVLYTINPEIGSLAYANEYNLIPADLRPYIAHFRALQSEEKISLLHEITNRLALESDERKHFVGEETRRRIVELEQNGAISIETIKNKAVVKVSSIDKEKQISIENIRGNKEITSEMIRAQGAYAIQKMKYETNLAIIKDQEQTKKYLADNQINAIEKENEAYKYYFDKKIQLESQKVESNFQNQVMEIEHNYLIKLKEAEIIRDVRRYEIRTDIINTYLFTQALLAREGLLMEFYKQKIQSDEKISENQSLSSMVNETLKVIKKKNLKKISVNGQTPSGKFNIDVEVKE